MRLQFLLFFCLFLLSETDAQNFVTPAVITALAPDLNENSGLLNLEGEIWTHNDNGGEAELYRININNGSIFRTVEVHDAENVDWEDIAADEDYVYIGDFGNNDGSRTNLRVYRISRSELLTSDDVDAEKIKFEYSNQTNFEPNYHNTNFDCEAMISFDDKLYLFTKNWIDSHTKVYELSNEPGTHIAQILDEFNCSCLVTGAEMVSSLNTLLLSGYNGSGGTYTWIFNNFSGSNFFSGNNTKLIWTMLTQVEGICYAGNNMAYASSEKLAGILEPTLYSLDLSGYMTQTESIRNPEFRVFWDQNELIIRREDGGVLSGSIRMMDLTGKVIIHRYSETNNSIRINMDTSSGIYLLRFESGDTRFSVKVLIP